MTTAVALPFLAGQGRQAAASPIGVGREVEVSFTGAADLGFGIFPVALDLLYDADAPNQSTGLHPSGHQFFSSSGSLKRFEFSLGQTPILSTTNFGFDSIFHQIGFGSSPSTSLGISFSGGAPSVGTPFGFFQMGSLTANNVQNIFFGPTFTNVGVFLNLLAGEPSITSALAGADMRGFLSFSSANLWFNFDEMTVLSVANSVSAVPLPGSLVLFGSGLAGIVALRRRRKPAWVLPYTNEH